MAKKNADPKDGASLAGSSVDEFARELIKTLNKEQGTRVAYNLSTDMSPTHIKRWISTGCRGLDYIISNRRDGGLPEGRVIEIFGPPSIGKSHIGVQIARSTQQKNGIVIYMDTENATQIENLQALGVDIEKRFIFCEPSTVEEVFQVAERTIVNAKKLQDAKIPVTIIWDSVAATPPESELKADYDQAQIGAQARAISKGMRKITQLIGHQDITFVVLNQTRTGIAVMYGDPTVVPGGKSIPYHASVRIRLGAGQQIKDPKTGNVIGINVSAKTIKNKIAYPFRQVSFEIHFGKGVFEHEQLFDLLRLHHEKNQEGTLVDGKRVIIGGTGAWKKLTVTTDDGEILLEKKFHKSDFGSLMRDPEYVQYIDAALDDALIIKRDMTLDDAKIDTASLVEVDAAANAMIDGDGGTAYDEVS